MSLKRLFRINSAAMPLIFALSACTHAPPPSPKESISLCDENGCAERARGYSSFEPEKDPARASEAANIAALEAIAAQDPRAAYDLGLRFFRGDGIRQDSYRAIQWMRDAAERGDFDAQKALGRFYLTGIAEMGPDVGEAEKWLTITAGRGDSESATLLQEAAAARQSQQQRYQWYRRWRPVFYNLWSYGYPYYWYWRGGGWYLR